MGREGCVWGGRVVNGEGAATPRRPCAATSGWRRGWGLVELGGRRPSRRAGEGCMNRSQGISRRGSGRGKPVLHDTSTQRQSRMRMRPDSAVDVDGEVSAEAVGKAAAAQPSVAGGGARGIRRGERGGEPAQYGIAGRACFMRCMQPACRSGSRAGRSGVAGDIDDAGQDQKHELQTQAMVRPPYTIAAPRS